ncbi:MAG TPA: hypothetical protein VFO38_06445 [Candidatus Saccharimonadales bacterium]|nr:hypothetical protein [Candidatus Saccharimonadales bacterium]
MSDKALTIVVFTKAAGLGTGRFASDSEEQETFQTFNQIPEELAKKVIRCRVSSEVAESGYGLGETERRFGPIADEQVVRLTSTGVWLCVEGPNVASVREAWDYHLKEIGNWRRANWSPRRVAMPGEYGEQDPLR